MKLLLPLLLIPCLSFGQVKAKHNPRYMQEGIYLKDGGQIAKDNTMCKLINVRNTMRGFKHTFIADSIGVIYRYYYKPLVVDSCYQIKTIL